VQWAQSSLFQVKINIIVKLSNYFLFFFFFFLILILNILILGNDKLKYRRTKLTQIDVNSSNYAEIIRLTTLLDEAYAKIKDLSSENKKLMNVSL